MATVTGVERCTAQAGTRTTVYNFEVQGTHTYFVGSGNGGEWVHNQCNFVIQNLQHEFSQHASQFGITGPWNKINAQAFMQAILDHIAGASVKLPGTFRGTDAVMHYFDPVSELWVGVKTNGDFAAGWKLSQKQITYLFSRANIE